MKLDEFIRKWSASKLKERQGYQEHFRDICSLLGFPFPSEADSQGEWFCFEYGVSKQGGGDGWADVFRKGCFGWEYKGKHKDLDAAYRQLLDYRVSLLNPPLLIVCDFERFRIYTNFTNCENGCYEFDLASMPDKSLLKPDLTNFAVLRAAFEDPNSLRIGRDPLRITEDAAKQLGDIAIRMRARGIDPMQAAHFVMKLIFCLFAEDVGLLPNEPLTTLLHKSRNDFERRTTNKWIAELISKMDVGGEHHYDIIPEFDGGLFDGSAALPLENGEVKLLEIAAEFDWSKIEPSIFGTLLERSLDPKRQQQLGAHYTRPEEVMKVIEPVVLEPLREEWFDARARLLTLAGPRNDKMRRKLMEDFLLRLRGVRILDPACGSGNFLYLALRAVMDLEDEVRRFAHKEHIPILTMERVGPEILLGREIDPYAQQLASTVIWIGYIQKRMETGNYDERPVLRPLENIVLADSLLNPDGTRAVWQECDYIVGNPPFLGHTRMRSRLGDDYTNILKAAYPGVLDGKADLCCAFLEQARLHLSTQHAIRVGMLATNSIRHGDSRVVLERIATQFTLYTVWSDLPWVLDGAQVRISILCFTDSKDKVMDTILDGVKVPKINADLSFGIDLTSLVHLSENKNISFIGDQKTGSFEIPQELAEQMLVSTGNPHGLSNSDVVKPWMNARQLLFPIERKEYIIDFGVDMSEQEAAKYVMPFEYVLLHVKPERDKNANELARTKWWIHWRARPAFRTAISQLHKYLATPRISNNRLFVFLSRDIIPDSRLAVFSIDDWYRFGILQSQVHLYWTYSTASDLRGFVSYVPSVTFETFPLPRISPHLRERYPLAEDGGGTPPVERAKHGFAPTPEHGFAPTLKQADALIAAVEQAAKELYEMRDRVVFSGDPACNSYTALYKAMPTWLKQAHAKLDAAVLACYGLPPDAGKHEILEFLLAENLARSGVQG